MIEVEQTKTGALEGNCFAAAFASLLELPIDDVPHWARGEQWDDYVVRLRGWLRPAGWTIMLVTITPEPMPLSKVGTGGDIPHGTLLVAGVRTVDDRYNHALVVRDGKIVWDPSPNRDRPEIGLAGGADPIVEFLFLLVPLDPATVLSFDRAY